jgi:hypothetical protein
MYVFSKENKQDDICVKVNTNVTGIVKPKSYFDNNQRNA